MTTKHTPENDPLTRMEAYITALESGADAGLGLLQGEQGDEGVAARVTILFRAERFEDIVALVESRPPSTRWCDRAIHAFVRMDRKLQADRLLAWARDNAPVPLKHLCALRYGQALVAKMYSLKEKGEGSPASQDREYCENILKVIHPLVDITVANNAVQSALEASTLLIALHAHVALRNGDECKRLSTLLFQRKPVPLELGKLAMLDMIPIHADLPDRLRADYAGTGDALVAGLLAADLEGKHLGRAEQAFWAACALEPIARTTEERVELWRHLRQLLGSAGAGAQAAFDGITQRLIHGDSREAAKHRVEQLAQSGDLAAAESELRALTDETDPEWLQLQGALQWAKGEKSSALETLVRAARLFPHADLLREVGALAIREKRDDIAEELLTRVTDSYPHDRMARHNLATLLFSQERFAEAIPHYEILRKDHPAEEQYGLNLAASLTLAQRPNEAIVVFNSLCDNQCSCRVLLGRAQLLRSLNDPKAAFASLQNARSRFWDDVTFVCEFLNLAYAAGDERLAHEAFVQLRSLQDRGIAGPEVLQEKSLDDMVRMMESVRERDEGLLTDLLAGKIGWVVVESIQNRDPSIAWAIRTQPVKWLHEDPMVRASHTLYTTNGVRIAPGPDGLQLVDLEAPPAATAVVADVSALITLERLGVLDQATEYLGRIHVPAVYAYLAMNEATHLVHHQWSTVALQDELVALSQDHQISTVSNEDAVNLPRLDEHTTDDAPVFRLADLASVLFDSGRLSQLQHTEFANLPHRPAIELVKDKPLQVGQRLVVSYSTLATLHSLGWLQTAAQSFRLLLEARDQELLNRESSNRRFREDVRRWSTSLWKRVIADSRFVQTTHLRPGEPFEADERPRPGKTATIASVLLAEKLDLPLLADDRFLQQTLLNGRANKPCAAFGTDVLLRALRHSGALEKESYARAVLQLLEWRYRFVVPNEEVLKTLSDHNRVHAPSHSLRRIANLMHDAMRDPGLLSGFEPTTPPATCAHNFLQRWTVSLAAFVVAIWTDTCYSDEAAARVTRWVAEESLPTTATRFGRTERWRAHYVVPLFLTHVGIQAAMVQHFMRARQMVATLQDAFGLERSEYLAIVGDLINAGND